MIEDIKPAKKSEPEPEFVDTPVSAVGPRNPEAVEVGDAASSS